MKKSALSVFSVSVRAVLFLAVAASFLFAWQNIAKLQSKDDDQTKKKDEAPVTVHAAKRGNPYVNFEDGRELKVGNAAVASGSQPVAEVAADFDSDGIQDIVVADTSGKLSFMHGNGLIPVNLGDSAKLIDDPNYVAKRQSDLFTAKETEASLGIAPDNMFAGDFNSDGKQDIIAAATGSKDVIVVIGDGEGHFSRAVSIAVGGSITAIEAGEVGRKDGQTDLAVAFRNKNGSFIAIYEHPESAFKHAPEIIRLKSPATAITIGNLDEDFYADIAVASGNEHPPWLQSRRAQALLPCARVSARGRDG